MPQQISSLLWFFMFCLVAITLPHFFPSEAQIINHLFDHGLQLLHLRKPGAEPRLVQRLLEDVNPAYRPQITIHYHHDLAARYALGGVHLSRSHPSAPTSWQGRVSVSCHSFAEVQRFRSCSDYVFLSPIFDSISKSGYSSAFSTSILLSHSSLIDSRLIALGGVLPCHVPFLSRLCFGGAAVLGGLWADASESSVLRNFHSYVSQVNAL